MASTKAFSLLFTLSLFSLTLATFIDPRLVHTAIEGALPGDSCRGYSDPTKCTSALPNVGEVTAALTIAKETMTNPNTIALAQESLGAAKEAGVNVLYFMSSVLGDPINRHAMIECIDTCNVTMQVAVKEVGFCIQLMSGKTKLTVVELKAVQKSLNSATESAVKCNVSCKQTKADMKVVFENLLDKFIKMSKIAIKVCSEIADAAT